MHMSPAPPSSYPHRSGAPYRVNDCCARTIELHNLNRSPEASDCSVIRVADLASHLVFSINNPIFFDISFLPDVKHPMMIGLRTPEIRDLITFEADLPAKAAGE